MRSASVILLILVAIVAVKGATKENEKLIRIPFRQVSRRRRSMAARSNTNATSSRLDRRASSFFVQLTSFQDLLWVGNIGLGTPAQTFQVMFNTAGSSTWVPDLTCGPACGKLSMYDAKASSTFTDEAQPFNARYTDGSSSGGTWTTDFLALTDNISLRQTFGRAGTVSQEFVTQGISGIVGLGFGLNGAPSLVQNLVSQTLLDIPLVSCRFIKDQEGTGEGLGELLFGGIETQYIDGDLQLTNIAQYQDSVSNWVIPIADMQLAGKSLGQSNIAFIDTAASMTLVSDAAAASLYGGIEGAEKVDSGWIVPMPFPSDVSFVIDSATFTIPARDVLTDTQVGDKYLAAIQGGGKSVWVLGSAFIKNQYLVFNFGTMQIGIGKRSDY